MKRPVVIINPLSSGVELAPAFKAKGIPVIGIVHNNMNWNGFGNTITSSDFDKIIPQQKNLIAKLKKYNPLAIIPGMEDSVHLADTISAELTPNYANDPIKSLHRMHKAFMQTALQEAGVPALKTLNTASEKDVERWIQSNNLTHANLIIKPPISAGSDNVFHVPPHCDWRKSFKLVLTEPSKLTGEVNETVVVQEEAIGVEYAVGTVSANGKHYLSHLIKYNKTTSHDRKIIYDHVEFLPYTREKYGELFEYTQKVLNALGIRWGAAHNEIMLTDKGPRLIEIGARMCGGPVVGFSREATGCSQADRLVELYSEGDVITKAFTFKKTVVPVFLKSPANGRVRNLEVLSKTTELPTFLSQHLWFQNGDEVQKTVDYLTSFGIIALAGERDAIFRDYTKIRELESQLIIT